MVPRLLSVLLMATVLLVTTSAPAQRGGRPRRADGGGKEGKNDSKSDIKPYDEVIPEEAESDSGLFLVHRVKDKVFFEIPRTALDRELLWVTQIAQTQAGFGYGGTPVGNRVVRWQLRGEDVLMRDVKYRIRADGEDSIQHAVKSTSLEPIIEVFPVKAWGKDLAPVVDVTDLFLSDLPEFSAKRRLNASGVDKKRTFIEEIRAFPGNIETKVLKTYKLSSQERNRSTTPRRPRPRRRGPRRDPTQGAVTVLLHHSMVELPEDPMRPRIQDSRVGFFSVSFEDYGSDEHQVDQVRYITRWRLEKKDPKAEVSGPVKPIVFYVGRGVPDKWRPFVRKGIEAWQPAFEAAGFTNAIIAKEAPSRRDDPEWDAEDARYSTIRWLPSTVENAMGPHVHDPRTGEILEADIIVYHNILKLCRDWYFVQASPMDERAQKLPLPDDLLGELLQYVISHEVGHSLGFPHNMKASSAYTVAQLRDPEFTRKNGTEASIMDYGRFNYVAQPGDGAALIPVVAPYDFFAVNWGYRQFPGIEDPTDEKELLAEIVALQVDNRMLRFGGANPSEDPSQQTEDLGADPIAATNLGLQNIARVAENLVDATCREGEDYELLRNMYDELHGQRDRELVHVANVVGGMVRNNLWYGDAERMFEPVAADQQRKAVAFLNERAFATPDEMLDADILLRLQTSGAADRVVRGQRRILGTLLSDDRIKRMSEHATREDDDVYTPGEMLQDVRKRIWSELDQDVVEIDLYRRNLQRAHVEILTRQLERENAASDLPALSREELSRILEAITKSKHKARDIARVHLVDVQARVEEALYPKNGYRGEPASSTAGTRLVREEF